MDALTGLLNRKALTTHFAEVAKQAEMTGRDVCMVLMDLDHFKSVNDEHGHSRGDAVLRDAADVMRANLRSFELVYRVGGEEFLVLMPGVDRAGGRVVAERLRAALEQTRAAGTSRSPRRSAWPWPRATRSSSSRCSTRPTKRSTAPRTRAATASCWRPSCARSCTLAPESDAILAARVPRRHVSRLTLVASDRRPRRMEKRHDRTTIPRATERSRSSRTTPPRARASCAWRAPAPPAASRLLLAACGGDDPRSSSTTGDRERADPRDGAAAT